jgi:hypothetical protein
MTLNISLISRYIMAQSSDLRLTDPQMGKPAANPSPKQIEIVYFSWRAIIGYSGVANLENCDTHQWLVDLLKHPLGAPEPRLADVVELIRQRASKALTNVPHKNRRHTFMILAFIGTKPIAYMISNYQGFNFRDKSSADNALTTTSHRPGRRPLVRAIGALDVTREDKRLLKLLPHSGMSDDTIGKILASINRKAWERCGPEGSISEGCVSYVLHANGIGGSVTRAEIQSEFLPLTLFHGIDTTQQIRDLMDQGIISHPLTPITLVERSTEEGSWAIEAPMATPRMDHTATRLMNGDVLVVGGRNGSLVHSSAEIYLSQSRIWISVDSMTNKRHGHQATELLDDRILVSGGKGSDVGSCEIFDPSTRRWSTASCLEVGRYNHTSTRLQDGKVLVVGGLKEDGSLAGAELYDPTSDTWVDLEAPKLTRCDHSATLLLDGRVLVVGGRDNNTLLREVEVYDPKTNDWTLIARTNHPYSRHTATLLNNGCILFVGAQGQQNAELFDPYLQIWKDASSLSVERHDGHAGTLLEDGNVLISGGGGPGTAFLATTERYIYETNQWEFFGTMAVDRTMHTATLLKDGSVLIVGGGTVDGVQSINISRVQSANAVS